MSHEDDIIQRFDAEIDDYRSSQIQIRGTKCDPILLRSLWQFVRERIAAFHFVECTPNKYLMFRMIDSIWGNEFVFVSLYKANWIGQF